MIRQFFIENFKSFAEPTAASLDELLVVAGSNSGGKSTIIQALLLLSQTLENPRPDVVLDLGGKYVQFAEFGEAVFGRPNTLDAGFTIGFDVDVDEPDPLTEETFFGDFYLSRIFSGSPRRSKKDKPSKTTNPISIRITFRSDQSGTPLIESAIYEKNIYSLGKVTLSMVRDRGSKYRTTIEINSRSSKKTISPDDILRRFKKMISESETQSSVRSRGVLNERFFMEPFIKFGFSIEKVPSIGSELVKIVQNLNKVKTDPEKILNLFLDVLRYTFQEGLVSSSLQKMPFDHFLLPFSARVFSIGEGDAVFRIEHSVYRYVRFFDAMFGQATSEIRNFLRRIKYIGPLRAKPERAYLAIGSPIDIGNAGENAVPILWLYQNDRILSKTSIGGESNERKLVLAVQDWLQEFGIAYSFHITKPKRVIYQAELESAPGSKTMVTIADVGFGVSQLLPVIVAGLRAPKDSTLILEQPEIHLHPRLQGKLADFLICMVELGKKVIVETHSEHLINMLRLRIAQDKSGYLQKKIGIIFVRNWQQMPTLQRKAEDKDKQGSYIENLRVDGYGKIINWPPDFFPEATNLNEEILKAMMDKFSGGE